MEEGGLRDFWEDRGCGKVKLLGCEASGDLSRMTG